MGVYGGVAAPNSYVNLTETDRQVYKHLAGDTPGVVGLLDFQITALTGMNVQANFGRMFVEGKNVSSQGYYIIWADTVTTVPVPAVGALPRLDRVVAVMRDSQYGALPSGKPLGPEILVVPGTPNASPAAQTDVYVSSYVGPGGWLELATISVPANATSISSANIVDKRTFTFSKRYVDQAGPRFSGYLGSALTSTNGVRHVYPLVSEWLLGGMKKIDRALQVPRTGLYDINAQGVWENNASGYRQLVVVKNPSTNGTPSGTSSPGGSVVLAKANAGTNAGAQTVGASNTIALLAGDRLSMYLLQSSGSTLNMTPGIGQTFFQVKWAGESS